MADPLYKTCAWPKKFLGAKPGVALLECRLPVLTTRPELLKLMTNEFHQAGMKTFDPTEPRNYIKRLSCPQLALLASSRVKSNRLTALVTFGDGYIDRLMGATYTFDDKDMVRPNASLAFFNKAADGKVELLLYTRFFVMSYFTPIRKTPEWDARTQCRGLGAKSLTAGDKTKLFAAMSRMRVVRKGCASVTDWNPRIDRYAFVIEKVANRILPGRAASGSIDAYIPFMRLRQSGNPKGRVRWYSPGKQENGMHGIIDTHSCWMLFRNHLWNWPDENSHFNDFAAMYSTSQRGANFAAIQADPKLARLKSAPGFSGAGRRFAFYHGWRNYTYIPFLQLLAGLRYDGWNPYVYLLPDAPDSAGGRHNCSGKQASPRWGTNVLGQRAVGNSWADVFLFKRTDRFTKESGDTDEFG